jgi:hypothetical protein
MALPAPFKARRLRARAPRRSQSAGRGGLQHHSNEELDMAKGNNSHKKEVKKPKKEKPKPVPTRRGT